jgi:release factor glutamine methyltransferase
VRIPEAEQPSIGAVIRVAAQALAATSDTARLDAELMMAHALGVTRSDLLLRHLDSKPPAGFRSLLERRLAHEPVAYILGSQAFYGLELKVSPAVLIPRGDSEVLIDAARDALAGRPPKRILDLGTGSGALVIAAQSLWSAAEAIGIERSGAACAVAQANAARHGKARILQRDWSQPDWAHDLGQFDLILANPPYIESEAELATSVRGFEPAEALYAGADGLSDYRALVPQLSDLLTPGGVALVEIGATQAEPVAALALASGLSSKLHRDLAERPRALEMAVLLNISLGKAQAADYLEPRQG